VAREGAAPGPGQREREQVSLSAPPRDRDSLDVLRASFDRFAHGRGSSDVPWLALLRTAAMARFAEKGFPTTREEAWRHTNVAPIARTAFRAADGGARLEGAAPLPGFGGSQAVFVNGRFSAERSSLGSLPSGVEVASLRDVLAREPQRLEPLLGRLSAPGSTFTDLNTAFVEDGVVVFVAEKTVAPEPIQIAFLSANPDGAPSVSYPRVLVVAAPRSEVRVVELYDGPEGHAYFTNAVTEIAVGAGASVDHSVVQRDSRAAFHVHSVSARLQRDARFGNCAVSLGAELSRNDIEVRFEGEGGECSLDGLFVADGRRHTDTHTLIDHASPRCSSRELYKGIVDGGGRGVFDGTIVVRKDAQKTDSAQSNKNLLLSRGALVHSTPRLVILADDVKCKHGSTTGQLDEAALFYLRSRGISEAAARSLLVYAFASDLVGRFRVEPVRRAVEAELRALLPGGPEVQEAVA
jgi:Fe-S cluster assembly protein SufD